MDQDFISMRVSTLRGDLKIDFDVYVKINDKMILYIRRGDSFEGPRLKRLREKKLKKMFIQSADESKYRRYLQLNIDLAYDNKSGKDLQTRSEIIHGQQQSTTEEVFENMEDVETYQNAKEMAGKYAGFLLTNSKAVGAIMNIDNTDKNIAHHGVAVSALSVALAERLKSIPPEQIQLLALGALMHDFGHYELGSQIAHAESERSEEEQKKYKTHCVVGSQKIQDKKHFDPQVIKIINEHEECVDGSGYPSGLYEKKMDPLSVIVASANALDRMISFDGVPKNEAPKKLTFDRVGKHPIGHIQILGQILKDNL